MLERNITQREVERVLNNPDLVIESTVKGRQIAQKILIKSKRKFLYRVIFAGKDKTKLVITVYRTTKINKYQKGA